MHIPIPDIPLRAHIPAPVIRPRDEVIERIPIVKHIIRSEAAEQERPTVQITAANDPPSPMSDGSPSTPSHDASGIEYIHHNVKNVAIPVFTEMDGQRGKIAYYYRKQELTGEFPQRTMICCHGIGGDAFFYYPLLNDLPAKYCSIILFDLYGRGRSGDGDYLHTSDVFVREMRDIIDHLSLREERLILLGHSMGGAIVMDYYKLYNDQVDKVVLLNPAGGRGTVPKVASILNWPKIGEWVMKLQREISLDVHLFKDLDFYGSQNKDFYERIFSTWTRKDFIRFSGTLHNSLLHMDMNKGEESLGLMTKNQVPLLFVWGQFDVTIPTKFLFKKYEKIVSQNHNAQIYVFKNCRHGAFIERHHDFMIILKNFLRGGSRLPTVRFPEYTPDVRFKITDLTTKKLFEKKFQHYMI